METSNVYYNENEILVAWKGLKWYFWLCSHCGSWIAENSDYVVLPCKCTLSAL